MSRKHGLPLAWVNEPGDGGELAHPRGWRWVLLAATVVVTLVGVTCIFRARLVLSGAFDQGNHLADCNGRSRPSGQGGSRT